MADNQLLDTLRFMREKREREARELAQAASSPIPQTSPERVDPRKTNYWSHLVESDIPMEEWPVQPDPNNPDEMEQAHWLVQQRNFNQYDAGISNFLNESTLGLVPPISDMAEQGQEEFPDESGIGQGLGMAAGLAFDPLGYGMGMAGGKIAGVTGRAMMKPSRLKSAGQVTDRIGSEVTSMADSLGDPSDINKLIQQYNDSLATRGDMTKSMDIGRAERAKKNMSLIDEKGALSDHKGLHDAVSAESKDLEDYTKRRNAVSKSNDDDLIDVSNRMGERRKKAGKATDYFNSADRVSLKEMNDLGIGDNDYVQGHLDDIRKNLSQERAGQYGGGVAAGAIADYATDEDGYGLEDLASSTLGAVTGVGIDRMMSKGDEATRLLDSANNKVPYANTKPRSTTIKMQDREVDLRDLNGGKGKGRGGKKGGKGSGDAGDSETPPQSPAGGLTLTPEKAFQLDGILDRGASDASLKKGEYRLGGKGYLGVIEELGLSDSPELRKIIQRKVAEKRKGLRDRRASVRSTVGDNIGDMVGKGAAYLQGKWRKAGLSDPSQQMIDLDRQVAEMADRLPKGMTPEAVAEWRTSVRERLMRELGLAKD